MVELFLERTFEAPVTEADVLAMGQQADGCFGIHGVEWQESLLGLDGRRMVCRFRGPDVESVRVALRRVGADITVLWPGTVHERQRRVPANVVVERRFNVPVAFAALQAVEDAGAWCLETHRVTFARTFFSHDRRRMLCLYGAPDVEAVRAVQRQLGMPVERVWAFRSVGSATTPGAA